MTLVASMNPTTNAVFNWLKREESFQSRLDVAIARSLFGLRFATDPKPPQGEIYTTLPYMINEYLSDEMKWGSPDYPNLDGVWGVMLASAALQVDCQALTFVYIHDWLERPCLASFVGVNNRMYLGELGIDVPTDW